MNLKMKQPHTDEIKFLGDDDLSNLEKVSEIGSGGGGRVYKVFIRQYYALKEISMAKLNYENIKKLINEYEIINHLQHPNIIKTFGILMNSTKYPPCILLEYCPSNLETLKNDHCQTKKLSFQFIKLLKE